MINIYNKMKKSELQQIIKEEIQNVLNENKQFKDLTVGDTFLRFGENGQMWKKINSKQAEFVKNVGKKTAPYDKKPGTLGTFPPTMDITSANTKLIQTITPNN